MTYKTGYAYSFGRADLDPGREWDATEQAAFQQAFDTFYDDCANGEYSREVQSSQVYLSRMIETDGDPVVLSTSIQDVFYCPSRDDRAEHFNQRDYI